MNLVPEKPKAIAKHDGIEQLEADMLNMEQANCPVINHFGPGIWIREVSLPKHTVVVGHKHRHAHLNLFLSGKLILIDYETKDYKKLEAPMVFTAPPGRKVAYTLTECVWQNIYATDETDIETLENTFLDKSETWADYSTQMQDYLHDQHQQDREDFDAFLNESNFTKEYVQEVSENEADQIDLPVQYKTIISIRKSPIQGKGVFLSWPKAKGDIIGPARIGEKRTQIGRYTNHSARPNCEFKVIEGDIYLVAKEALPGCMGGNPGDELTVDYRLSIGLMEREVKTCQAS